MKKERKTKNVNKNLYRNLDARFGWRGCGLKDTRYYGVFKYSKDGKERYRIDPIRYQKNVQSLDENILSVINLRKTHYFYPQKEHYRDYTVNYVVDELKDCSNEWQETLKKMKDAVRTIVKPKELSPGDDYMLNCGIRGANGANAWARDMNYKNKQKYAYTVGKIERSIYGQFFHQFVSRMEAASIKILKRHNIDVKKYNRNLLYGAGAPKNQNVLLFDNYKYYNTAYLIWHFIKHNTESTYDDLKAYRPDVLINRKYVGGDLGIYYVKFSEGLIEETINGCIAFFKEYCLKVFEEDYFEAQWNYDDYFVRPMKDLIDIEENPLGLSVYDEMD